MTTIELDKKMTHFFMFIFGWVSFRLIKYRVRFLQKKKKKYRVSPFMGEANLVSEANPQNINPDKIPP